ncbi:SLC13 family permease [Ureibacillus composti]|nr:SLC13 family permease [Ureibacillus composti]
MSLELFAIIFLLLMFVIGAIFPINIGVLGFVAAFIIGTMVSGLDLDTIFAGYPADLFVLLAGITYMFAIVQKTGTIDLIANWGLKLVRGNLGLIPWVVFFLGTALASIGTSAIALASILAPIVLRLAYRYNINALMMGVMLIIGITGGAFSPLNLFGIIVSGVMETRALDHQEVILFLNTFLFCFLIGLIVYISMGGLKLFRSSTSEVQLRMAATVEADAEGDLKDVKLNWQRTFTLLAIAVLIVLALVLKLNMGFCAFMIGLVLAFMTPKIQSEVIKSMPWPAILMVTGIVTYVSVLEEIGALQYMTDVIASLNNSYLASLVASYTGGIISSFASTTGFLSAIIPLATPILQDPAVSSTGVIAAISISSSVVDLSPFSTNGALLLSNARPEDERSYFRQLLVMAGLFVLVAPLVAWLLFVVIGTPWG